MKHYNIGMDREVYPNTMDARFVHAGRQGQQASGAHVHPIALSTTYRFGCLDEAVQDLDAAIEGKRPRHSPIYTRLANPTVDAFEFAMAQVEGADDAVAFGSGMAALTACILAARANGSHVVGLRPLYGGTDHLLGSGLLGNEVSWATAETVAEHIRPDTGLVVVETPANPTIDLVDLHQIVRQAGTVPVLVDATFATPVLLQPLAHGAALSVHSATKFIGGHGDAMGGVVSGSTEWMERVRQVRTLTGAVLHPMAAYLLHRGLQTLPMRVRAAQATATELAKRLLAHAEVGEVFHPSVAGRDPRGLLGTQMAGPGAVLAFDVATHERADALLQAVRVMTPAVSLGSCDTLIQHPAGLTHRIVPEEARSAHAIGPGLLRISVGLEDVETLWQDLASSLALMALGNPDHANAGSRSAVTVP